MKISRKMLFMLLAIGGGLFIYLTQVSKSRKESVRLYFGHPREGDIYKVSRESRLKGYEVYYLRVRKIEPRGLSFYPGTLAGSQFNDVLLRHFDSTETLYYSGPQLEAMAGPEGLDTPSGQLKILEISR
jgi:hypothetical protein